MKILHSEKGFTLLEIIVGVLAGLALPRFFATVEYAKSVEALNVIGVLRGSMERCYMLFRTYVPCEISPYMDVDNPANSPNSHFSYDVHAQTATGFILYATRNTLDGGNGTDRIYLQQTPAGVTRWGTGAFVGLQ